MTSLFKNYRKAKKGECTCNDCKYHVKPDFNKVRIRCNASVAAHAPYNGYAVGKTMRCDYLELEK